MKRHAIVVGGGGDVGAALAHELVRAGWAVTALGRSAERICADLGATPAEIREVDVLDTDALTRVLNEAREVDALVYNVGLLKLGGLMETTFAEFEASWRTHAGGAFAAARALAPGMLARGGGAMIFLGATGSVRGGARSHAFASSKHALRGLAYCLAKELGPRGVHVAHVVVDGRVRGARTRQRFHDVSDDKCIVPTALAQAIHWLIEQPASAWTFELDLRASAERWR